MVVFLVLNPFRWWDLPFERAGEMFSTLHTKPLVAGGGRHAELQVGTRTCVRSLLQLEEWEVDQCVSWHSRPVMSKQRPHFNLTDLFPLCLPLPFV